MLETMSHAIVIIIIIIIIIFKPSSSKSNVYKRSWSNFNENKFVMDFFHKDCDVIRIVKNTYNNHFFDNFFNMNEHAP